MAKQDKQIDDRCKNLAAKPNQTFPLSCDHRRFVGKRQNKNIRICFFTKLLSIMFLVFCFGEARGELAIVGRPSFPITTDSSNTVSSHLGKIESFSTPEIHPQSRPNVVEENPTLDVGEYDFLVYFFSNK